MCREVALGHGNADVIKIWTCQHAHITSSLVQDDDDKVTV